jgi:hypothetical protein
VQGRSNICRRDRSSFARLRSTGIRHPLSGPPDHGTLPSNNQKKMWAKSSHMPTSFPQWIDIKYYYYLYRRWLPTLCALTMLIQGLKLLAESLDDVLLHRLVFAIDSNIQYSPPADPFAGALEHYSCGRYPDVVNSVDSLSTYKLSVEATNLKLRAEAFTEVHSDPSPPHKSQLNNISVDLALISQFSEDGINARNRLQSTTIIFTGSTWASSLSLILERQLNDERASVPTVLQKFHGPRSQLDQPLLCFCFTSDAIAEKYLLALNIHGAHRSTNCLLAYISKTGRLQT